MLRRFFIWLIKNLIVLFLIAVIFSTVILDIPYLVKGIFKDIFQYASLEAQKEVVSKLTSSCSALDGKGGLQQQMSNGPMSIDFSKIGSLCKDYSSSKINEQQFFFGVIGTAIPDKFETPKVQALEKYNSVMDFLNKNKLYYIIILLVLFGALYLLSENLNAFLVILTGISFSIGTLILLPYAAIIAYDKFVGINTTSILTSMLQGGFSFDIKAIMSVILLMVLRTYTGFIITVGFVLLAIGIAGKIYAWKLRKKSAKAETRSEKISEKNFKKEDKKEKRSKDEDEEAYKHRNRSYKEILDELDEMHKKKMKEKNK